MKILFFISTLENDGAERAMSNITMHLPEDVEADILLNSVSDHDFPTKAHVISLGMSPNSKKGIKYQLTALFRRIPTLHKLKKSNHYDACISFMDSANLCNILTGNKYCKTIVSVRVSVAQDKSFLYRFIVQPMVSLLYNKADYVVAVAEQLRKELIEVFGICPDKVKTITNGYDVAQIRQQAEQQLTLSELPCTDNKFVYVTVGRFTAQKAQWHLIRAFEQVVSKCQDAVLFIIGQGEDKAYLEEIICTNKLEGKVILLPYQKNIFPVLNQCDVFVMPSMFEGYCNALCEALICGLPCIATDFQSSAREILAPDMDFAYQLHDGIEKASYGMLTPVCSGVRYKGDEPLEHAEESLAEAMILLHQDKALFEEYQNKAFVRGKQMDIAQKVQEWIALVK